MSHSKWACKYHVVSVPKRRRKLLYGSQRQQLGAILHELARQKECRIVEGHLTPDHAHLVMEVPPKHAVASIIAFLKGKSAVAIARPQGRDRNLTGEHFWARGMRFRRSASNWKPSGATSASKTTRTKAGASEASRGITPL